jgi:hypothetical protein
MTDVLNGTIEAFVRERSRRRTGRDGEGSSDRSLTRRLRESTSSTKPRQAIVQRPDVLFSTAVILTSGIRSLDRRCSSCQQVNSSRRHHRRPLARFDAAPQPSRSGPLTSRLANAERELRTQFIRIAQLQAQLDLVLGALRDSPDGASRAMSVSAERAIHLVRAHAATAAVRSCGASVAQHDTQERIVHFQGAVVVDEPELPKLVHEEVHSRTCRADHFG